MALQRHRKLRRRARPAPHGSRSLLTDRPWETARAWGRALALTKGNSQGGAHCRVVSR